MEPRKMAQLRVEQTYAEVIAWSKKAFCWIVAVLNILAFLNFGADGTRGQHNSEDYSL